MTTQIAGQVKAAGAAGGEEFEVLLVKDDRDPDYAVFCPALPGCGSQGSTSEEALAMIADAIAGYLAYDKSRPAAPASCKDDLIAEFTSDGCDVAVFTVLVSI